ncbi:hypothetical protein X801_09094, partial [Opisthorchis viverrini]
NRRDSQPLPSTFLAKFSHCLSDPSVPSCSATQWKYGGSDNAMLFKSGQEQSRCSGWVQTKDHHATKFADRAQVISSDRLSRFDVA